MEYLTKNNLEYFEILIELLKKNNNQNIDSISKLFFLTVIIKLLKDEKFNNFNRIKNNKLNIVLERLNGTEINLYEDFNIILFYIDFLINCKFITLDKLYLNINKKINLDMNNLFLKKKSKTKIINLYEIIIGLDTKNLIKEFAKCL